MTATTPNIAQTAREALNEANHDWQIAAQIMRTWVDEDAELREALTEPLLSKAIWAAITSVARTDRTKFHAAAVAPQNDRTTTDNGLTALANDHFDSLLNFPLHGGKPLGDATQSEVLEAATFYLATAKTNAVRGRWLTTVAQTMRDGKTVRQHRNLNDNTLRQMLVAAESGPVLLDVVATPAAAAA